MFISKISLNFSLDYENQEKNLNYTSKNHFRQEIKIWRKKHKLRSILIKLLEIYEILKF